MQDPRHLIIENLKQWQEKNSLSGEFEVSIIENSQFGDLTTNIAMVCKIENSNPRQTAENIVFYLKESEDINRIFEKIEVAGAGFINFFLSYDYLFKMLEKIVQKEDGLGTSDSKSGQKVIVEFGDPNPFKEIHIGHLRNFCIGEAFCRLLESQGAKVIRANYQGDVGLHVAKAMWGLLKREEEFLDSGKSEEEKVKILADSYVEGATEFENNEAIKQEIQGLNKRIYEEITGSFANAQDDGLHRLWEEGRKVSLEHFEEMYKRIGLSYDKYYYESVTAKRGKEIVLSHIDDGIFERNEGAVVYRGEQAGLHTRVFLTSADYATYEGKDLALAILKNEQDQYDLSVILTGNEQLEYFQVMLSALKKIAPQLSSKTSHYTFGHVRLKDGKMSSRTGDVVTANWLLDEAVDKVRKDFDEMDEATAEKVGVGAVKYSMLKFSIPSDIHFSFEESISLEGNSGPYLQYAYVRTQSVLTKANSQWSIDNSQRDSEKINNQLSSINYSFEENGLLRFLSQYPHHLEQATKDFAPNLLCNYLFELSQKFNLFYQKHSILNPVILSEAKNLDPSAMPQDDNRIENVREFRLNLTKAVGNVLKKGLHILGIQTVEKM